MFAAIRHPGGYVPKNSLVVIPTKPTNGEADRFEEVILDKNVVCS
jgi:hypothetical protein